MSKYIKLHLKSHSKLSFYFFYLSDLVKTKKIKFTEQYILGKLGLLAALFYYFISIMHNYQEKKLLF